MNENSVFLEQYYLHKRLKEEERKREEEYLKNNLHLGRKFFYTVVATFFLIGSWTIMQNMIEAVNLKLAMSQSAKAKTKTRETKTDKVSPVAVAKVKPNPTKPVSIVIPSLGKEFELQHPRQRDSDTLNKYLLKGPVYYPDSRQLEEDGNILILGHSSYLPFISEAYKTFNGVENLKPDDEIILQSPTREYIYKVKKVRTVVANDEEIKLKSNKQGLTLSTCNSFGRRDERFVVEAELQNSYLLTKTDK